MADEITYSISLQAIKGNLSIKRDLLRQTVDMAGDAYSAQVQSIPTTAAGTAVDVASAVGTPGYAFFRNLDDTNFIDLGVQVTATFYPFVTLKAGEGCVLRLTDTTFHARADTSAVLLESVVIED